MHAFLAIVTHGGFTRAADSLHLSQPAISRRIQLLERELGAPLFERVGAGLRLSDAGHAFLPHAQTLVAAVRDAVEAVDAVRGTSIGGVTLALVGTLAGTSLTDHLRAFRTSYPGVDLRLRTALSAQVSELVRRGDATVGLRYGLDAHAELVSEHVYSEPMLPVCAPDHPLARKRRVTVADLAGQSWVAFPARASSAPEPYASAIEQRLTALGLGDAQIVPIDSLSAQKRLVEAGFGLALLQASSVQEELRSRTLCELGCRQLRTAIPVVLIYRRWAFRSGATDALLALLRAWPDR